MSMTTTQMIEITAPFTAEPDGTVGYVRERSLAGLRVAHAKPLAQTSVKSRTGVEHKPPTSTQLALLETAASDFLAGGPLDISARSEANAARALEKRGLGETVRHPRIRARVVGFRINARGRAALTAVGR